MTVKFANDAITMRNAAHKTRKPMDIKCWKCRAALVCISQAFVVTLERCDRCKRKTLVVAALAEKDPHYFEASLIVDCNKYSHVEGVLCANCAKRKERDK